MDRYSAGDKISGGVLQFPRVADDVDVDVDDVRPQVPPPEIPFLAGPSSVSAPSPIQDLTAQERAFPVGMTVEVESYERGYVGSWYAAKILSFVDADQYWVEYQTLYASDSSSELCTELVDGYRIRPRPPPLRLRCSYALLDQVDAWYNDGWWIGQICRVDTDEVTGKKEYSVYFWTSNEVYHRFSARINLRPRQEWIGGNWIATPKKITSLPEGARLGKALQRVASSSASFIFPIDDVKVVEVRSDVEGYGCSWYPALVLERIVEMGKYILQRLSLAAEDGSRLPNLVADGVCMRPSPPPFEMSGRFKEGEPVEAWIHGGWFEGRVERVLEEARYMVLLENGGETHEFQFLHLRPHQVWSASREWTSFADGRVLSMEEACDG